MSSPSNNPYSSNPPPPVRDILRRLNIDAHNMRPSINIQIYRGVYGCPLQSFGSIFIPGGYDTAMRRELLIGVMQRE